MKVEVLLYLDQGSILDHGFKHIPAAPLHYGLIQILEIGGFEPRFEVDSFDLGSRLCLLFMERNPMIFSPDDIPLPDNRPVSNQIIEQIVEELFPYISGHP